MDALAQASLLGIELEYVDARGEPRQVPAHAVARIADALRTAAPGPASVAEDAPVPPRPAYQGPPGRWWLLATQLYGARSRRNWGHGDFADLFALIELAAALGAGGVGLNPLHALFDEGPEQPSPYSPNSRLFLNPLYIAVDEIADFADRPPGVAEEAAHLREAELVDYAGVARLKQRCLRAAFDAFQAHATAERRDAFAAYRGSRGPALERFAAFEVLRARFGHPWWEWPAEWRDPSPSALARLRAEAGDEMAYREYLQWIADRQLMRCRDRAHALGLPIGLYLDVAVGVRPDGFDAWNMPDAVIRSLAVGAPPDPLNTRGQNWGLAGFSPVGLQARAFGPYRDMLRAAMRYAGAIRLDHVLGLKRLYLIPDGLPPDQGAYVRLPFEQMLAVTAEESNRDRCIVIGEDLGTVPQGFRATLAQWGIWSYQVMLFERDAAGAFHSPQHYRERALATFSTHDLATFAGWIGRRDLQVKKDLGLDPGETARERAAAIVQLRRLLGLRTKQVAFPAVFRRLATSPARMLVAALEDALGVLDQVNVPGTIDQHPNWRRKLPCELERLRDDNRLHAIARIAAETGRSSVSPAAPTPARQRDAP